MKKILIISLCLSAVLLCGNSVFSPQGYPITPNGNDVYGMGMGNTGIADTYRINVNMENPSLQTTANSVTLSTAVKMGYYWYEDAKDRFRDDGIYLPYFSLIVPIKQHRFGISLKSMYSGDFDTGAEVETEIGGETIVYEEINRKSGNIYRLGMHYAYKSPIVNLGVSALYYQGNNIRYWSIDFEESEYDDTKYEIEKGFSGINWNIGLNKQLGSVALGVSYEPGKKLDGNYYYKYNFSPGTDTLSTAEDLFELPATINGGITWAAKGSLKLNLDMRYRMWGSTEITYENNFTGEEEEYENSWRIGSGISYDPLLGYGRWYESIPVRAGFSIGRLPFKNNEETIEEYSFSLGSSLQLNSPGRKIDFALGYTIRQTQDSNAKHDESLELSIGLTGIDVFKKRLKRIEDRDIPRVDPGMEVQEDRL